MPASKQTFAKYQRERDKRAKAQAKAAQRALQREERAKAQPDEGEPVEDQSALLDQFARLHQEFEAGRLPLEEFEQQVSDLRSRLRVD